jgi:hypothetical protein
MSVCMVVYMYVCGCVSVYMDDQTVDVMHPRAVVMQDANAIVRVAQVCMYVCKWTIMRVGVIYIARVA